MEVFEFGKGLVSVMQGTMQENTLAIGLSVEDTPGPMDVVLPYNGKAPTTLLTFPTKESFDRLIGMMLEFSDSHKWPEHPCDKGCQYAKDIAMPEHSCSGKYCHHYEK